MMHSNELLLVKIGITISVIISGGTTLSLSSSMSQGADSPAAAPGPSPAAAPATQGIRGGYWDASAADAFLPSMIQTFYFTHLLYAFVVPNKTSFEVVVTDQDQLWMKNFTTTLHSKSPAVKTLLSIGGAASDKTAFARIASCPNALNVFITSALGIARDYGFDGIDLDWEYPDDTAGMSNLLKLVKQFKVSIKSESIKSKSPSLLLTAAVYYSNNLLLDDNNRTYPTEAIKDHLDFANVMCYEYRGSWDVTATGEHALLYDHTSEFSTSHGISAWVRSGVPAEKLVMGLPLFGKTWNLKDQKKHGIGDPANGTGPGDDGVMLYYEIANYIGKHNASVVYDRKTVSTYAYAGNDWIGYDNEESIKEKVKYAKEKGLLGYFFWAINYDKHWAISKSASDAWDSTK